MKEEIITEVDQAYQKAIHEKSIEAIAHGNDSFCNENFSYVPDLFSCLENYIRKNYQEHFLLEDAKKNLLALIGYLRFEHKYPTEEERVKRFHWCNHMIGLINNSTSENSITYYCNQLAQRSRTTAMITYDQFTESLDFIYDSIIDDITLLESLDERVDFYHDCYEEFLYNPYICNNISILFAEYPNIFQIEDLLKLNSILIGQYFLATSEQAALDIPFDNNSYRYQIDEHKSQFLTSHVNIVYVKWLMDRINNIINSSMSPHNDDIDENHYQPEDKTFSKYINKKK